MIGPVGNNNNQNDVRYIQGPPENPRETPEEAVQGKVNPVEPSGDMSDESVSNEETPSRDTTNKDVAAGQIVDILG